MVSPSLREFAVDSSSVPRAMIVRRRMQLKPAAKLAVV